MKIAIILLLLSSMFLVPARGFAQQGSDDPVAAQAPVQQRSLAELAREQKVLKAVRNSMNELCGGKMKDNAKCKLAVSSEGYGEELVKKIVADNPDIQTYIKTGVLLDKPIKFDSLTAEQKAEPATAKAQLSVQLQPPMPPGEIGRITVAFESVQDALKEFCAKNLTNTACKSPSTQEAVVLKIVRTNPELRAYYEKGVFPDKPIKIGALPVPDKPDARDTADASWMTSGQNSADSASAAAKARMDRACTYDLSMVASDTTANYITNTMADCVKATNDWEDALKTEAAAHNRAKAEAVRGSVAGSDYLISLTGTPGLPVTGNCNFAGKYESYDDVLPAEHVATAGRGVPCSFVKKYVQGTLKMQIIQNGVVRNEAETEASYGVVTLDVDW